MRQPASVRAGSAAHQGVLGFLSGGGEMGERMRALDWSATPLGAPEHWPQSLQSAIGICLNSHFPIGIYWGPQLAVLYNDAWKSIPGEKHPWALGRPAREVWPEVWAQIGPLFERVQSTGEGVWQQDRLLPLDRHGYTEECYFNFTFSPIRSEDGTVAGIFNAVLETTFRVIEVRRMQVLRELGERTTGAHTAEEACARTAAVLGAAAADVPFCLLYLCEEGAGRARLAGAGGAQLPEILQPAVIQTGDPGSPWPLAGVRERGTAQLVQQLAVRAGRAFRGTHWPEPIDQALVAPIAGSQPGELAGLLVTGVSPRRVLDAEYRTFLERIASQVATAIGNARAYEAERRRAESLAELDRAKTTFFSNVSHEFRTPLTLLLGPLEEALKDAEMPARARERLGLAYRGALGLQKLVNSLLDFSTIEAGRARASYEPVDLAALTRDLASTFRSMIERAGLRFEVECPPLSEPVYVDRDMWEKIVLNLLSNAFKFTFEGTIAVRLGRDGGGAVLEVQDTGVGIPQEEIPRVFERFHRVRDAQGRTNEGTGIGLALVQELVRLHGGSIEVASEPGRGTTFSVRVPFGRAHLPKDHVRISRAPGAPAAATAGSRVFAQEASGWLRDTDVHEARVIQSGAGQAAPAIDRGAFSASRPRIVLADDNADMRNYICGLLSTAYSVEAFADGEAALAAIRRERPALVLSDVMMPRLDGLGLLGALRSDETLQNLPVILLSARAGEESRLEGLDAGADEYLVKPFSARELLARVGALIELEQARRASAERLRQLFEQAPSFMAVLRGPRHVYELANRAYLRLIGQREVLGKPLLEALPELVGQPFPAILDRVFETGEPFVGAGVRVLLGSEAGMPPTEHYVDLIYQPIIEPNGRISGVFVEGNDVTERRRAEESLATLAAEREQLLEAERTARAEAESAMRAKEEFLAVLSHELRTPLSVIVSWSRVLLRKHGAENADLRKGLELVVASAMAQSQLISDLLDISRITSGKIILDMKPLDLAELVARCVAAQRPVAETRGIELALEQPEQPMIVLADAARLQQVMGNLLTNALKFTRSGGHVRVTTRATEGHYEVSVQDSGEGIAPEFLPHVFGRFRQADASRSRRHGGLGLGLAIVSQLVEMHGGTVEAASAGLGHGACFTVRLPAAPVTGAPGPMEAEADDEAVNLEGIRVLIVEDEPAMLELFVRVLEEHGARVAGARSGDEALAALRECSSRRELPHVLVSDIGLPGMDGYALLHTVRESLALGPERLGAVAVTAFAREQDRDRARAAGFQAYLTKPYQIAQLVTTVQRLARDGGHDGPGSTEERPAGG